MTNCTKTCPNVMPVCCQNTGFGNGHGGAFAFILVLFILLVICGAAYLR